MELHKWLFILALAVVPLSALAAQSKTVAKSSSGAVISQAPLWASKPDAAAFEKIEDGYLAAAQGSVQKLVSVKGPRTVSNTLAVYDEAVRNLNLAAYFAGLMEHVHPDKAFREKASEMTRKASAALTALALNQEVYKALEGIDLKTADATTKHYVSRQLLLFRLAGVDRDDATRQKIKDLNDKSTDLQSKFAKNIAEGTKFVMADPAELEGLPQDYIARHKPDASGKVKITTDYPDFNPVQKFAKSDALRKRLAQAYLTRAYPENKEVLMEMIRTRHEIANTLGYPTWADYFAADKMIRTGKHIDEFIKQVHESAEPIASREFEMLLSEKRKTTPDSKSMETYENSYYSELVRRSKYDFDSTLVRPYFPYKQVKDGVLGIAQKLFQLQFKKEADVQSWDPLVETYGVYDKGKKIGRFYLDMHPRAGKFTHAEMVPVRDGIKGKQLSEAALVCNFPVPTADDPGLMEFGDVETFFHEFGHLMHWILAGQQPWAGVSGLTMEADFVEAPSMMLENWMHSDAVLSSFARHYKTGQPIPSELVKKLNKAQAFGRALWVSSQDSYTAISYDMYSQKPESVDPDKITTGDTEKYTPFEPMPDTHMYASFGHLAGYSSAYYTYLWDLVIAQDFFERFNQKNPMLGEAPARYRKLVLEPGGSESANELVRDFLGRPQNTKAFQKWMNQAYVDEQHSGK
ncbi:MAG TPA: M3 family metallopeptidase [Terriglobales bacterium]|nr:M3 family metallopeptidase [Terriglobales bacterium]